ncbi:MAG: thioredoxin family protein [Candidatus Cloacimonetes bacterium]|nr:thioredoxin family protein [Candidatus Cloacimonadota bacterium]MCF7814659.1 thioredoxin family protein [Candidatus Cloacimonadota bacterium]MCF7869413.1 thioredoxin family protein [Candidatus Cloacimonadota bacterium]MCF7884555.1 thioredoxin family protein [Candidatus Cloacimonadota bacterium]
MKKIIILILFLAIGICFAQTSEQDSTSVKPKITFLELGSKTCVPCKMMEPVLESIREKYGDQIQVIFHDVKKKQEIAEKYKIRMIPTQIFLDAEGNEIHRHIGFYAEEQIDEFLQTQGLTKIH